MRHVGPAARVEIVQPANHGKGIINDWEVRQLCCARDEGGGADRGTVEVRGILKE
jgi:hypothetical protein